MPHFKIQDQTMSKDDLFARNHLRLEFEKLAKKVDSIIHDIQWWIIYSGGINANGTKIQFEVEKRITLSLASKVVFACVPKGCVVSATKITKKL